MKTVRQWLSALRRPTPWRRETPSTAIYFSHVLADLIADAGEDGGSIERIEPNVFRSKGETPTIVVVRTASPEFIRELQRSPVPRLAYVIDDDVLSPGVFERSHLPKDYAKRIAGFARDQVRPLLAAASDIVAPSEIILDSLRDVPGRKHLIRPAMVEALPDLAHFEASEPARFDMVFNASRSHLYDLQMIAEPLRAILDRYPQAHLTTFLAGHVPHALEHPQAHHHRPLGYAAYREMLASTRFHLALAPAADTVFNRARSPSRILDNAAFGAAALHSDLPPFDGWLVNGVDAILVRDDAGSGRQAWYDSIEALVRNPSEAGRLAEGLQSTARRLGDPGDLRAFWLDTLKLG